MSLSVTTATAAAFMWVVVDIVLRWHANVRGFNMS